MSETAPEATPTKKEAEEGSATKDARNGGENADPAPPAAVKPEPAADRKPAAKEEDSETKSAGDVASEKSTKTEVNGQPVFRYGVPVTVETSGHFPAVGSTLGPYFCLGQLGKGTFSSIHKCVEMRNDDPSRPRLAAAKVELSNFSQSGVLDSEASILEYLHKVAPGSVPVYLGHYKSSDGRYAALVMEYLGDDMHALREQVNTKTSRRMNLEDAVELTANVMLPLLKKMHEAGFVHRDVKPSNCVRKSSSNKEFCLVDFGLSKSIVVAQDAPDADKEHPWTGTWMNPANYSGDACYRKEREKAEFRGTSMYASLRVHQLKDYAPRDDMYSLLYVFCDLASGGLPWMSYAANRERDKCQELKQRVHGEGSGPDETEQLLMGDEYHVAKFHKDRQETANETNGRPTEVPEPHPLSKDKRRVDLLRKAFAHLGGLNFWDRPDYDLIKDCITGFVAPGSEKIPDSVRPVEWFKSKMSPERDRSRNLLGAGRSTPQWAVEDDADDAVNENVFDEIDGSSEANAEASRGKYFRLPVELRFRIAQIEYNRARPDSVPKPRALDDWMKVALPLLYGEWDTPKYEEGANRTSTDGLQRPVYLDLLRLCKDCAGKFGNFHSPECYYQVGKSDSKGESESTPKRRKTSVDTETSFVNVSRALYGIDQAIKTEVAKKPAPTARLSFG